MSDPLKAGKQAIDIEMQALAAARDRLGRGFEKAVHAVNQCGGKVVVTGIGKSGHVGAKIAATMSSLGIPAIFMHSTEALHGDSGIVSADDVAIAISNSGKTDEVINAAAKCKELGATVIAMTGGARSELAKLADIVIDISVSREADPLDLAPTSSTTVTIAVGDALAVAVSSGRGFAASDFAVYHSGGTLGRRVSAERKPRKK